MFPALNLLADASGLHRCLRLKKIGQGRFAHTGRTGQDRGLPAQIIPHSLHTGFLVRADKHDRISGLLINASVLLLLCPVFQICLIKTDGHRNILSQHHNQKTVQQVKVRIRLGNCKNHQCLVHIGRCRTYQHIFPWKYLIDISLQGCLVQHRKFHVVSHDRLDSPVAENSFCLAGIYLIMSIVDIIKACDSFNDFSCHIYDPF